jgi:hypothetical protein
VWYALEQRLRHCAINRKVTGSNRDASVGIYHSFNNSCSTNFLGSTQPLTEMITTNTSWGRPVGRAENLATVMCRLS